MQGDTQNYTENAATISGTPPAIVQPAAEGELFLTAQQDNYISYLAVGGMVPAEDGPGKKIKAEDFAHSIGVSRETLYYWRKHIPDIWELVAKRRKELFGKDRLAQVWNGIYLKAAAGNPQAAALYLTNFDPEFKMPNEKQQNDDSQGFMDLLQRAREFKARDQPPKQIMDAQVITNDTHQEQPQNIPAGS
jgi:hypothetical protein